MAKTYIKFNSAGFRSILVGGGVRSMVSETAQRMASSAGFDPRTHTIIGSYGGGRAVAFVATKAKTPKDAEKQRRQLESAALRGGQ